MYTLDSATLPSTPLLVRANLCSAESGTGIISQPALNSLDATALPSARPRPLAHLLQTAFGTRPTAAEAAPAGAAPPRPARRKLWELPTRWHCALIGTCLAVDELRRLAARAGFDVEHLSDYSLHSAAVSHCDTRNPLTEAVQRTLDKRHAAPLAHAARRADSAALLAYWQDALADGSDIAGTLWAVWTQGALDEDDGQTLYGDLHMLSHQSGAAVRADLRQLQTLKLANAQLRDENQALRIGLAAANAARERNKEEQRRRAAASEQQAARLARDAREVDAARQALRAHALLTEQFAALNARVEVLEARNAGLARRHAELAAERAELSASLAAAETALAAALGVCDGVAGTLGTAGCGKTCPAAAHLAGRCVLCIGGRTGLVDGYRRLVEQRGGQFLHHDGGQEESLHRLDASLAAADAVVCQSGCVSHAAYWRLKDACKKLGKPCIFVKSPGVGSFARSLDALAGNGAAQLLAH